MVKKAEEIGGYRPISSAFLFYRTFTAENGISAFAQCLGVKQFLS